ncbi:hypothetical protein BR93DRAFT_227173 [Coniochaeta sp. PMI_546]|nr:hypothetical protein BR93DRAFT_227173 [Coniochaeta sp. PMI_546]
MCNTCPSSFELACKSRRLASTPSVTVNQRSRKWRRTAKYLLLVYAFGGTGSSGEPLETAQLIHRYLTYLSSSLHPDFQRSSNYVYTPSGPIAQLRKQPESSTTG